jgi:carbon-monoxide dehydrogenase small subunit
MLNTVTFELNGDRVTAEVEARTLLVEMIREELGYTGTHVACDTSQCGACDIHVNGRSVKSCTMLAMQVQGAKVKTIEGVARNGELHPLQLAFREHHGLQCGFCTPGMIMSALELIELDPQPSDAQIRRWLEGNLCRCTGYQNIVRAVRAGAHAMRGD